MTENALSILIVVFSVQLQQTEISERKLFIFHHGPIAAQEQILKSHVFFTLAEEIHVREIQ